jgi:hypothetical protein
MPLGDSLTDGYNVPGGYRIALEDALTNSGQPFDFVVGRFNGPVSLADQDHEGHVGFKIAAMMGETYIQALHHNRTIVSRCVTENLLDRHIKPLFT